MVSHLALVLIGLVHKEYRKTKGETVNSKQMLWIQVKTKVMMT
uniref:Uncharacterized protein n=1 Tax=Tetranychus urticae TaxID=32264 RepID=T1K6B5_TETUR